MIKSMITNGGSHVVCFSGGHSSAITAVEVVRKYGADNTILLNHDIISSRELPEIKKFKNDVAEYLGLTITYANFEHWSEKTPVEIIIDIGYFTNRKKQILCTNVLKTKPFYDWMAKNDPDKQNIYYYGFDNTKAEMERMRRRISHMAKDGYKTDYPLALWQHRTIQKIEEINVERPTQYNKFKHANCMGCLKAGWAHFYIIYCDHPDIFDEVAAAEQKFNYSLHKDSSGPVFLDDKRELFDKMMDLGIEGTEHIDPRTWWASVRKLLREAAAEIDELDQSDRRCDTCTF